ncbi:SecDF P1 head subdomain-containing protein [Niabella hibiscisoli]|uniref:SecDF P1 head subdomain-containing protein n=1 Tax=Niabella hibiscisoli TaxID=1825928 RepID=UPI00374DB153
MILIRFNKAGAAKLEKFSVGQQGKQVALVVDQQVVAMPFIAAPISNGSIHINWGSSSNEVKTIVEKLQNRK